MPSASGGWVIGHVGRDPEIKTTNFGDVMEFSVAKSEGKDKETTWYKVSVWGKPIEWLADSVRKGGLVHVSGELSHRAYVDKNGNPVAAPEFKRNVSVQVLSGRNEAPAEQPSLDINESDVPF